MINLVAIILSVSVSAVGASNFDYRYERSADAHLQKAIDLFESKETLQKMVSTFDRNVRLPHAVTLVLRSCGEANAFYDKNKNEIIGCIELFDMIGDRYSSALRARYGKENVVKIVAYSVIFAMLHELGHAIIDQLDVPVLGREEDAADRIATYLFLQGNSESQEIVFTGAIVLMESFSLPFTRVHLADAHEQAEQRQSNIACLAFGANPSQFSRYVGTDILPYARASGCGAEYEKLKASLHKTMGRNVRLDGYVKPVKPTPD